MNCDYTIKHRSGKQSIKKTFSTDDELDAYIAANFDSIVKNWTNLENYLIKEGKFKNRKPIEELLKYTKLFDESSEDEKQAKALEIVSDSGVIKQELRKKETGKIFSIDYNDIDDATGEVKGSPVEIILHDTLSATTKYLEIAGNYKDRSKRSIAGYDEKAQKEAKIKALVTKKTIDKKMSKGGLEQPISEAEKLEIMQEATKEAEQEINKTKALSDSATKAGDDCHKIMEVLARKKMGESAKLPKNFKVLTPYDIGNFGSGETVFEKTFNKICSDYNFSKDAKFFPEFEICSKYISPGTKQMLEDTLGKSVDGIVGKIDLLVIDKGKAYIFDYKTSRYIVGDWADNVNESRNRRAEEAGEEWMPSSGLDKWKKQVALYAAILESWGIEVGGCDIVNFHIKYKKNADGTFNLPKYKVYEKDGIKRIVANQNKGEKNFEAIEIDDSTWKYNIETEGSKRSPFWAIMHTELPHARTIVTQIKPITPEAIVEWEDDVKFAFGTNVFSQKETAKLNPKFYRGYNEQGRKVYEDRIKALPEKNPMRLRGYKYVFYYNNKVDIGYGEGQPIYFDENYKTAKGETADQILEKYCEELEKVKSSQYYDFGQKIINIMQIGGKDENAIEGVMRDICGYDSNKIRFMKEHIMRYLDGSWQLLDDKNFLSNGIYMFYDNDKVEIVSFTTASLFSIRNYGTKHHPNNTILGNLCNSVEECDPYSTMSSSNGNMLLMRIMALLSRNQSSLAGKKVRDIKIINPFMKQATWSDMDYLYDNWMQLCAKSNGKLQLVDKKNLYNSTDAAIEQAKEVCFRLSMWDNLSPFFKEKPSRQQLIDLLNIIKKRAPSGSFDKNGKPILNSQVGYAYYCIQNALLLDYQVHCPFERDGGKIFEGGLWPLGYYFNNPGRQSSVIVRMLDNITNNFRTVYSKINNDRIDNFNKLIKIIYEDYGFNPNTSTRKKFFAQFFEEENGTVGRQMRIKDFSDPIWDGHAKAKEAFMKILDTFAEWRSQLNRAEPRPTEEDYNGLAADESVWERINPERYREIPLIQGTLTDYLKRYGEEDGLKGIVKAVGNRLQQKAKKLDGVLFGEFEVNEEDKRRSEDPIQYGTIINNRYLDDNDIRGRLTSEEAHIAFSTDFEEIIGMVNLAQALNEASKSYGPLYAAMMSMVSAHQTLGGIDTPELSSYINDYVKKVYHGESLIDDSLKLMNGLLGFVKSATSALALKLNTRAFTREMLVSFYNGLNAAGFKKIPGVTAEDFAWGLWYTIRQAPADVKKNELVGYLNRQFQLAGQSKVELATSNFITDFGLATFDADKIGYATTTLPDGYYRVGILCAMLHADGAFEAYEQDGDTWKYNPKKDKRFAKYLSDDTVPTFKEYDTTMGSVGQYTEMKALWNSNIQAWRSAMSDDTIMVPLQAYTPSEIGGIQEKAEDLYGAFDIEHKSLMCSQFIGSALLQYKTWIAAQINRWIKQGGHVNTWQRMQVKDSQGRKLYILSHTSEEIAAGKPSIEFITEDQITPEMAKEDRVVPYIKEVGMYMEGELRSTLAFCDAIIHMDGEELKRLWKNQVSRAGLIQGIMDAWGMLLFAGLVKMLYGEDVVEHKSEQPWITQWTYGVLMGFAEDGPVWSAVGSLVQDFNPPALLSLQRMARITKSVIAGNKTLPQGVLESMGATREFSYIFAE